MVSHRLWLAGILADTGGLGLQVYALHLGALAVVQPLLVIGLLFALALNHVTSGGHVRYPNSVWQWRFRRGWLASSPSPVRRRTTRLERRTTARPSSPAFSL